MLTILGKHMKNFINRYFRVLRINENTTPYSLFFPFLFVFIGELQIFCTLIVMGVKTLHIDYVAYTDIHMPDLPSWLELISMLLSGIFPILLVMLVNNGTQENN